MEEPTIFEIEQRALADPMVHYLWNHYLEFRERYDRLVDRSNALFNEHEALKSRLGETASGPVAQCPVCGGELVQSNKGRKKRYCSESCKQKAKRKRH